MTEISKELIVRLRQMTGAGITDCKKALEETAGDLEAAVDLLRKKGAATAAKKAMRETHEGVIAAYIMPGARIGVLVEVNCETDFVARNDMFREFAQKVARILADNPKADLEPMRTEIIGAIRENIQIPRFVRYEVQGNGMVAAYIHTGAKIGVLLEVCVNNPVSLEDLRFKELVKDLTLQIAAASPQSISRDDLPQAIIDRERRVIAESDQVKNKPPQVLEKIIQGRLEKFYQTVCLMEQGYIKRNSEISVGEYIREVEKLLGDKITVKRFTRYQVGEITS